MALHNQTYLCRLETDRVMLLDPYNHYLVHIIYDFNKNALFYSHKIVDH